MGSSSSKSKKVKKTKNKIIESKLSEDDIKKMKIRAEKRKKAVDELLQTEQTYINRLTLCIDNFAKPLKNNNKLISFQNHETLFKDLEVIRGLNSTFLNDLQSSVANWDNSNTMIGDYFIKFTPYFRMYQNYMNNYAKAMEILPKLLEKQAFFDFCNEARKACNNAQLQSLLILPIQRMPRYTLSLKEIIKNTEPNHPDLRDLKRGLELVEETTQLLNERMKEFEARQEVRAIEQRFSHNIELVQPSRKFVKEGVLTKVHRTGKDRGYVFFLFNDLLVYASGKKDNISNDDSKDDTNKVKLKCHANLPIDRCFYFKDVNHSKKYSDRSFEIYSSVKSFIVYTTEYNIKKDWMDKLRQCMKEQVNKPGATQERELAAPLMVPDDYSDVCQISDCNSKFTFINRRHHCRYCGKLICAKCGKYKLAHKTFKKKIVKVCIKCYNQWNNINPAPKDGTTMNDSDDSDAESTQSSSIFSRKTSKDNNNKSKHVKQRSSLFGKRTTSVEQKE